MNEERPASDNLSPATPIIRREMARGLRYAHFRANANTHQLIQVLSTVEAATALLEEKGILQRQILDKRKAEAAESIGREFAEKGLGVQLEQASVSKYAVENGPEIDCANRISLCDAACCKMHFPLTTEDLQEGKIRWDVGHPYVIAQGDDGWCVHLDRQTRTCGVYEARPSACRTYDCRGDSRIWLDFEKRIINPQIKDAQWPRKIAAAPTEQPETPADELDPAPRNRTRRLLDVLTAHPDVWSWGDHFVSSYGVFLSLAFAISATVWLFQIRAFAEPALGWLFLPGAVLATYAGSRLLRAAEGLLDGLLRGGNYGFSSITLPGHALYGGLAGGIGFTVLYLQGNPNAWWLVDRAAPAIALGFAIGRLGCLAFGCCIGCPTTGRASVSYSHPLSKAVAYYGLDDVPLVPLQVYESLIAFALAIALFLLPESWFGAGRALGLFLIIQSVARAILLPLRFHPPGPQASALVTGILQLAFATVGTGLLLGGTSLPGWPPALQPAGIGQEIAPLAIVGSVALVAALVLLLFGVHEKSTLRTTNI